uniref:Uncharacterized protein n=1 Tax=Opuntia streptacantha TaxID=393608 RepID=A0A7C8Z3X1_OPUST
MLGPVSEAEMILDPVFEWSVVTSSSIPFSGWKPVPTPSVAEPLRPLISRWGADKIPALPLPSTFSNLPVQDPKLSAVLLPVYFISLILEIRTSLLNPGSRPS